MSNSLLTFAVEHGEEASSGLPPIGFGLVAFVIFVFLLLVVLAFRSVGTRHR
ncbi:hypothetical protein [Occultella gossypii]|uniref:Uncharacterized protein n=1 Tax=Occultella gossypii TaxID=2800820 RepID=A0ABS7SGZ2_9MICO|nr:hypothetical protein [Occultella gossypii]MBZ2198518.1 hypothetical protein [Occultella gossypii]